MKYCLVTMMYCCLIKNTFSQTTYLLVGTYNNKDSTNAIYSYLYNTTTGVAISAGSIPGNNASYLTVNANKKKIYAVSENANTQGNGGGIVALALDEKTGALSINNNIPSNGNHPCYITTTNNGKYAIVGNYSTGNFSTVSIKDNGLLYKTVQTIQHTGNSTDTTRQKSPHVHTTVLSRNNKKLYVADLGTDYLYQYKYNPNKGTVKLQYSVKSPAGSGPRHLAISSNNSYLYLLHEISGTIITYNIKRKKILPLQAISTMPVGNTQFASSADIHIHPNGKFLYATNRGKNNTIASYSVDEKTGLLTLINIQPTGGLTPRNFSISPNGKYVLVAHQNSNTITTFTCDNTTGLLTLINLVITVTKPVCLQWLTIN